MITEEQGDERQQLIRKNVKWAEQQIQNKVKYVQINHKSSKFNLQANHGILFSWNHARIRTYVVIRMQNLTSRPCYTSSWRP